jgi:PST family polysaccharide transporter
MTVLADAPIDEPVGNDDLGAQVGGGLKWSFVNVVVAKIVSVSSGIVLARLLVPEDFGTYAVALAVVNVLFGLNDMGMLLAVVRWKGDLRVASRTGMTIAAATSAVLYAAVFAGAPAFARHMNSPDAVNVLRVLALTVVIDGLTTVPQGLLIRDFRQRKLAKIEFIASPVNFGTAIALGLAGTGPWSLALGQLAGNLTSGALLTAFAPFHVGFGFDRAAARTMLGFGVPLALTSLVEYLLLNADYIVVGQALGPTALGFYLLAYNISSWPVSVITDAVRRVSIAGFSKLADDEASLRERFSTTFVILLTAAAPVCLLLAVLAEPVVRFVYGAKWVPAADALRFLALLGGVRVAVGFVFDLLVGAGRTRTTLWLQIVWLAVLFPALVVRAEGDGLPGVAAAHALVGVAGDMPSFLFALHRFGVPLDGLARQLVRPAGGLVLGAAVAALAAGAVEGSLARIFVVAPAALAAYAVVVVRRSWIVEARVRIAARASS